MSRKLLGLVFMCCLLYGCGTKKPKTNWSVTLDHEKKEPYGTWLFFETLPQYFPHAIRDVLSTRFRYTSIDGKMEDHADDSVKLLVMIGLNYYLSDDEWDRIQRFAIAGNEVFIISSTLDNKIETALKFDKIEGGEEQPLNNYNDGSLNQNALTLMPDTTKHFGFLGRSLEGGFEISRVSDSIQAKVSDDTAALEDYTETDSYATQKEGAEENQIRNAEVLGFTKGGKPNFIRYRIGSGHITFHAAPLAFSNYFLLQANNRSYLDGIWHSFPANISHIYYNEYYKRSTEGSGLNVLWRYPATRWALIIAIATLLMYVLLGLKRRQRIIPIVQPLENSSVAFVETIGRLYFNKGNHANLAEKMIQHFLEWVRTYYFLDTAQLGEPFIAQLAAKSGKEEEEVREIVNQIHHIRMGGKAGSETLHQLHHTFASFYNN